MYERLQDKVEAVQTILNELIKTREYDGEYAFVSYSEKDRDKAFDVIEILLRNGLKLHICEGMSIEEVHAEVNNVNCKCMITLTSKNYIYDIDSLLHQYARFSKKVRLNFDHEQQMPCLVIDLADNRCKYKDDIVLEESESGDEVKTAVPLQKANFLREGLRDLYQLSDGNFSKLIKRQVESVLEGDKDEIRRQMSFILDYDGHLDNVTNCRDIITYAGNTVKKLVNQGVDAEESLKNKCTNHFDEWGKDSYIFSIDDEHHATIVCSKYDMYIKKGSYIKENPTVGRSQNEKINNLYRKYILNGVLKASDDIGNLMTTENIMDKMTIEEVTLFVNGEVLDDCCEKWVNRDTGKKYSCDYAERENI